MHRNPNRKYPARHRLLNQSFFAAAAAALFSAPSARADIFDNNSTTSGFGVVDGGSYDWLGTGLWNPATDSTGDDGSAATATWTTTRSAYFVGAGAGTNYTIRLGATGTTDVTLGNLASNVNAAATAALAGAAGNVTLGNTGDTGLLILNAANSVGAQGGGTLTINNGVNLNAKAMTFRGGNVTINGVVSGTGASSVTIGGAGFGLTTGTLTLNNTANSYDGVTTLQAAGYTLEVTKLADGGFTSSIGDSSSAATNLLFSGGTLRFIGSGAQTTNRLFRIGTNGAFLDASGATPSDTIGWTNTGSPTYSATNVPHTLTLTGSNIGSNTYGGTLTDGAASPNFTSLTKTGIGKWIVNQSNAYTGGTNANGGTLVAANTGAFGVAGKTINFSTGTVEFATNTSANAYVLNVGSGNTGTVVVNRANSGTDMTHTMGNSTIGNGTLNIQKGANVTGVGTLEFGGITMSAGVAGLSTGTMLNPTSANVLVSGNITRTGGSANLLTLDGTSSGNLISGIISGSQTLTKSNSSTWELSNGNTFTGKTLVTGGTLKLTNNLAIQNSAFDTSGAGNLDITTINTPTFGGLIGDAGTGNNLMLPSNVTTLTLNPTVAATTNTYVRNLSGGATGLTLTKTGLGTQVLSGTNNYAGLTTVSGGILAIANNGALGTTEGDTTVTSPAAALVLANGVTVTGETILIAGSGSTAGTGANFNGALQAAASATAEWAGTVKINSADARVGAGTGGSLKISGAIADNAGFTVLNVGAGTGGSGEVIVSAASGTNTYTGNTTITRGTLKLGADHTLPTGTTLDVDIANAAENAIFDLNGFNQTVAGLQRTGSGSGVGGAIITNSGAADKILTINQSAATSFSGIIQDGTTNKTIIAKDGIGTLTLSGANTYTGGTSIKNGSLILTGGNDRLAVTGSVALGDAATSGKLVLGDATTARNQTLAGLTSTGLGGNVVGAHATNNSVLTINIASGSNTYGGVLGGGGINENKLALTKSGPGILELTGSANTYSGPTTINAGGTLALGAAGALSSASTVVLNGGTLLAGGFSNTGASLSLSAASGSAIDLSGTSVLTFTAVDAGSFTANTLAVWNWSGTLGGGGAEQFMVPAGSLDSTQLGNITFYSDGGTPGGWLGTAAYSLTNPGELVPVPEPGALATAALLAAAALGRRRRNCRA